MARRIFNMRMSSARALLVIMLVMAVASILMLLLDTVEAQPAPIQLVRVGTGVISYYGSLPSTAPGIVIRVYVINGSTIKPANAFISIYANLPNGVMPMMHAYGSVVTLPFSDGAWSFVINRWLGTGMPVGSYNTSLLVFATYVSGNKSWIVPMVIPYNVGWVLASRGVGSAMPRFVVAAIYINVTGVKPFSVVRMSTVNKQGPRILGTYDGYVLYNCSVSGPQPAGIYVSSHYGFIPEITCVGINGSLPLVWVTWSNGVVHRDSNLEVFLDIGYIGVMPWEAVTTEYGEIGRSYSANETWAVGFPINMSFVRGPGSLYWACNGTWAIINYSAWYVDPTTGITEYLGSVTVSEVLYVPSQKPVEGGIDYGNGPISVLYYDTTTIFNKLIGYSVLNTSSVIYYINFIPNPLTGVEELYECNGPVNIAYMVGLKTGASYTIILGGAESAVNMAQFGTGLMAYVVTPPYNAIANIIYGPIADEITNIMLTELEMAGIILPPSSTTFIQTFLDTTGISNGTRLYISVVVASKPFGIPTYGFILNATNYYGNPQEYTCSYGKVMVVG
ncbi:hypothetical protein [Vulcanisaeta thermophila]|uniref:hypothetical protein n=1 Tax=Vulcanisaeta thermophila TaxID=867917 RepID=UPI000AAA1C2B|nr:hypothetical protein [Vulcanisaeta thermophila]